MEGDEIKESPQRVPGLATLSDVLRKWREPGEGSAVARFLIGNKPEFLDKINYGESFQKKGGGVDPLVFEGGDFVPTGSIAKGLKMADVIGPVGMMNLGDSKLLKSYLSLKEKMGKANPKDWLTQKTMAEDAGFVPIVRGRDASPHRPTIKVGYEIPEGGISEKLLDAQGGGKTAMDQVLPFTEAYEAPRLLRAYPTMKDMTVTGDRSLKQGAATYWGANKQIELGPQVDPAWLDEVMAHEIQHKIQAVEGWPSGTSSAWTRMLLHAMKEPSAKMKADPKWQDLALKQADLLELFKRHPQVAAQSMYLREAGEQLAIRSARSHTMGGGRINDKYKVPYGRMWDANRFDLDLSE